MDSLLFSNLIGAATCAVGGTGVYLVGKHKRVGFLIGFCSEALWVFYAVILKQWTLLPWCFIWAGLYFNNWRKWRSEDKWDPLIPDDPPPLYACDDEPKEIREYW